MAETKDKVITAESLKAKHDYDEATYLKKSSDTMSGTLILTNTNDASPTSYASPALVVGGETTAQHLEIDTNEILAKANQTKPSNLFLNDDIGTDTAKVGISGSTDIDKDGIKPRAASTQSIGTTALPFNHIYGVNYNLYNKYSNADTDYGALRVGSTTEKDADDKDVTRPTAVLELGNNSNVDGRITMYGNGTTFTNILPNNATSGSNKVFLPIQSGTLAVSKTGSYNGYVSTGLESKPMELKLGFEANILFVWCTNKTDDCVYGVLFRGGNGVYYDGSGTTKIIKTIWDGNTVSWYTEETNALYGLSGAGNDYSYIAF